MSKNILITGVTGQDGSNMVRYLLQNTIHQIFGTIRLISVSNFDNIQDICDPRFQLITMDLTDQQSIFNIVKKIKPDYIINFAAQSRVSESWNSPIVTFTSNTLPILYFLEAIREINPLCRFYSAGSSEEFGEVNYSPQDIHHPMKPKSTYGASKCAARALVKVYRESYNLFAIHCILFNHEGIRRGKQFVTRKITSTIARIQKELKEGKIIQPLELGNINVVRDWSDSEDFVEAVWLMLTQKEPKEYVLSSDETHSVKEFLELSCEYAGLDVTWEYGGSEVETKLWCQGQIIMKINPDLYRPTEVDLLCGDSKETRKILGWSPKTNFKQLVKKMMDWDIQLFSSKKY
jgi:GDPmannose 4,6-dehydratase